MSARLSLMAALMLVPLLGGCARFEFNVVEPVEMSQHIAHDKPVVLNTGPLEYTFLAVEDRLVIRVVNTTSDLIHFQGDQSSVVDPSGQSHPFRQTSLPPGSHLKIILPPMAHLEPAGPRIGFGIGFGVSSGGFGGDQLGFYDSAVDERSYATAYEPGETPWDWPANAQVRLLLTFQRGNEKPFIQQWVLSKQKM